MTALGHPFELAIIRRRIVELGHTPEQIAASLAGATAADIRRWLRRDAHDRRVRPQHRPVEAVGPASVEPAQMDLYSLLGEEA